MHLIKLKESLRRNSAMPGATQSSLDDVSLDTRELKLCRSVAKQHFILNSIASKYLSFLTELISVSALPEFRNASDSFSAIVADLKNASAALASQSSKRIDFSTLSKQRAVQYLESNLQRGQLQQALLLVRGKR